MQCIKNILGVTLLEVIITISLFSVIALSLMRMTANSIRYRQSVSRNIKISRLNRVVSQVIKRDLGNVFYTKDINALLQSVITPPLQNRAERQQLYWQSKKLFQGGLYGKSDRLVIKSFSHTRLWEDQKLSDQNTVVYYTKSCESADNTTVQCLWRDKFFKKDAYMKLLKNPDRASLRKRVLIKNIETFKLSYFNIFDNQWKTEWNVKNNSTDKQVDANTTLPVVIKMVIEFKNRKKQVVKEEIIVPIYQEYVRLRMVEG